MLRRKREVFAPTDGILVVMDETAERQSRGIDFTGTEGLQGRHVLAFRQSRLRTDDLEMAEADGVRVTRKVVCRLCPGVDAGTVVAIDNVVHDVTRVDFTARNMTLHLCKLTHDGTCDLIATKSTRDARGERTTKDTLTTVYVREAGMGGEASVKAGLQSVWPTIQLTIRQCDYDGERHVSYKGIRYAVTATQGDGSWVRLTCEEGVPELLRAEQQSQPTEGAVSTP